MDLGNVGSKFMWCNKRSGLANIRKRSTIPLRTLIMFRWFCVSLVLNNGLQSLSSLRCFGLVKPLALGWWQMLRSVLVIQIQLYVCSKRYGQLAML